MVRTPAVEALEAAGAKFEWLEAPGAISGEDYANAIGADKAARLYKTLVMKGTSGTIYVFVVPALAKLAQRQTARGMLNSFRTIFDSQAEENETVIINGGGGGYLVELTLDEFAKVMPYEIMPLKK